MKRARLPALPLYPRAEFPRELDICLTDGCNLDCSYCYFDAKNRCAPASLAPAQIERGLDLYLEKISPSQIQKISFSGGEPLLCFDALLQGLALARKKLGPRPNIEVFTNGTLLDRRKAEQLLAHGPELIVSMDGAQEVCDAGRKFYSGRGRSVYRTIRGNMKKLGGEIVGKCFAGSTFSRATVSRMRESVEFLLGAGFKCVIVDLDVTARWDNKSIEILKEQAAGLKDLYARHISEGFGEVQQRLRFDFLISRAELAQVGRPAGLRELALAPDGRFYPSGLAAGYGPEKRRYAVGDLESGFNQGRMNAVLGELRGYFGGRSNKGYNGCPTHVYFDCRLGGVDPESVFVPGEKFFRALDPLIGPVIDFELLQNTLASVKDLGDFDHEPRTRPDFELAKLEIELSSGGQVSGAGPAREALDALLYSPGCFKRAVFVSDGAASDPESFRRLSAYALMKARRLAKKIKIYYFPLRALPDESTLELLREHGMDLVLPAALAGKVPAGAPRVWIAAGGIGAGAMRKLLAKGLKNFWFGLEADGAGGCPETGPGSALEVFGERLARGGKLLAGDFFGAATGAVWRLGLSAAGGYLMGGKPAGPLKRATGQAGPLPALKRLYLDWLSGLKGSSGAAQRLGAYERSRAEASGLFAGSTDKGEQELS